MSSECHSCAQTGLWRTMSRAWPAMSAITTSSGSTCPSHQESAWGTAEASQERVILEVAIKAIVVWKCWRTCWAHLQMFSVSTVAGEKASHVEPAWGASAKPPGRRPPAHWAGRGQLSEGVMFGEFRVLLLVSFRSVDGWMGMHVWVNVCLQNAILVRRLWTVENDV